MRLTSKMAFAALLLGSTFGMTTLAAHAATPGCPSATQKTEAEGGAGGNWQGKPGAATQKTEAEGGAGGNWQKQASATQKTEAEGGAGGNWQGKPGASVQKTEAEGGAGTQQASAQPCK
ncbi:MAG TPA: hypothetical protein VKQ27_19160 [Acetobacteraceae bacterium]|nr:hypothetical protein [Acetobacteraceae bacterium]